MLNHRAFLAVFAISACLAFASGAAAADPGEFAAAATPTHVKPSTARTYTIVLTSSADSEKEATRATITRPPAFGAFTGVTAKASATGACDGVTWNVALLGDDTIDLNAPGGNPADNGV